MPPKVKAECSVPLLCNLCPKSPKFSDISHLLTHISSKSHLANLFKLKIRAQGEQEAKDKLNDFDLWYNENNLDALLSERLAMKDQKKANKDKKNRLSGAKASVKKEEPSDKSALDATPVFRAPIPRMGRWNNSANKKDSDDFDDNWGTNSLYDTPTTRRRVPNFAENGSPSGSMLDPKLATPAKASTTKKSKNEDKIPDSAQLKGVLWPGMDLFDSATAEMRRMRNQRKDSNVMRQMMATSAEIEPAEISYFADGEFRGSRDIFGPLSGENSPIKEPSPKKMRRPRKPTFTDVSVNAPRSRTSRGKRAAAGKSPEKQFTSMRNPIPAGGLFLKPIPTLNPLAPGSAFGQYFAPLSEEDEEFKMTVGGSKKKRTFGVFKEAPGESPSGQTESSLEDHRFDFTNHGLPTYQNNSTSVSHTSPTPAPKPVSSRGFGKENTQSTMHSQMHGRQPNPYVSHVYPSQVFHNPSFNPLYNHAYAGTYGYGDHHNNFDMKPPQGLGQPFYGDFKPSASSSHAAQPQHKSGNANGSASASGSGTNGL